MTSAVLFGGPTPEHDISILTGLQALRELAREERDTVGIYWTKSGTFFSIASDVEAEAFLDGVPKGSSELSLRLGEDGGFFAAGGRLARERKLELDAIVLATHGGPGEDGTLQGALDLAGVRYSGPSLAGAAIGMDKFAFSALIAQAGLPTLPQSPRGGHRVATLRGPLHLEAPLWRLVDRNRDRGQLHDCPRSPFDESALRQRVRRRAVPR